MGFLEEMHAFTDADVDTVIRDIARNSSRRPVRRNGAVGGRGRTTEQCRVRQPVPGVLDERMLRLEKSMGSVLSILKKHRERASRQTTPWMRNT
jgi:general secretion pathway protein A